MSRQKIGIGILLVTVAAVGCEPEATPPAAQTPTTAPQAAAPAPPPAEKPVDQPVVAQAGVAKQGQSLRNETGVGRMIAQPAVTLFAVRERVVFEVQIPQAMQLWEASNGRKPKSHEEFMSDVIKANNIKLPELPAGKVYRYHPDDAQLWVHPANE